MDNVKLNKSVILVHNLLRIMRAFCVVAGVIMVLVMISFPGIWEFTQVMLSNPSYSIGMEPALLNQLLEMKDRVAPYFCSMIATGILGIVVEFFYLKTLISVVGEMRDGAIFAEHYGTELRKVVKLIIIQIVATFVLGTVLTFVFAPELMQNPSASITFNFNGLFTAAFVYFASYILDYGYYQSTKSVEPACTDITAEQE
ncbi:MAG: hypothetical protein E7218_03235 [Anaerofustis stercorihominis]|nr:hypothetical protein [Anaerofustis stercorihominis]